MDMLDDNKNFYNLGIAAGFASCAHRNQKRKYTNEPYAGHCIDVAEILGKFNNYLPALMAAMLHDVIEDTDVTEDELRRQFGDEIADLVMEVTDVTTLADGNRKRRKTIERLHIAKTSHHGANIKLADMISNTKSITEHDKDFAQVYLREKIADLEVLQHGNTSLLAVARAQIHNAFQELKDAKPAA